MKLVGYGKKELLEQKETLFEIRWLMTRHCNYTCDYCDIRSDDKKINEKDIYTICHNLKNFTKDYKLILTGGEVFTIKNLNIYIEYLLKDNVYIKELYIISNLSMPMQRYRDIVDICDVYNIPINFLTSFHKEFTSLNTFLTKYLELSIYNGGNNSKFYYMVHEKNCCEVYDNNYETLKDICILSPIFSLPNNYLKNNIKSNFNLNHIYDNDIEIYEDKGDFFYRKVTDFTYKNFRMFICHTPEHNITINPNGDVILCSRANKESNINFITTPNIIDETLKRKKVVCSYSMCSCESIYPKYHMKYYKKLYNRNILNEIKERK